MDAAALGSASLTNKEFSSAITHYTRALSQNPQAVDYYIKRSTAYTRVAPPEHTRALSDAETAVVLANKRGKRESIGQAQLRRGIALFGLGRWTDAGACFGWAKKLMPKESTLLIWEKKVEGKIGKLDSEGEKGNTTVKEYPDVDIDSLSKKEKKALEKNDNTTKNGSGEKTMGEENNPMSEEKRPEGVQTPASKIRHEWYQTLDTVVVTLFAKGVPKDRSTVDIQARSLAISFPLLTGSDFDFSLDPLFSKIDHSSSTYKVMSTKVELILKKATPGQKWQSLESTEPIIDPDRNDSNGVSSQEAMQAVMSGSKPVTNSTTAPAYPTSSKTGPKDWDKLATDLTTKPKKVRKNENPEAPDHESEAEDTMLDDDESDPVNGFFKKLYANADPDTKRAMMKSYQESNGTSLSTNWGDVGKGKVETSPPEGMVAKKWGE